MIPDRLSRMLPTVIPDSCMAGSGMAEKWRQMVMASFNRVSESSYLSRVTRLSLSSSCSFSVSTAIT